ncbi:MAG: hypothetical protein IKN12_10400 [Selenomonadaceae bacterium]|nr:hypothetical protein [Selenomonadaceae bacterium]
MRIYLDTCCYNRPYDNQGYMTIAMEAKAIHFIQDEIKSGKLEMVSSYILRYENENSPFLLKKFYIEEFLQKNSSIYVSEANEDEIHRIAEDIMLTGIKKHDAYHIACALFAKCDYFLTTDKRILKYVSDSLIITNPLKFVEVYGGKEK